VPVLIARLHGEAGLLGPLGPLGFSWFEKKSISTYLAGKKHHIYIFTNINFIHFIYLFVHFCVYFR
jgi:hypothetical protein